MLSGCLSRPNIRARVSLNISLRRMPCQIRELLHAFRVLGPGKISGVHRANRCADDEIELYAGGEQDTKHADLDSAEAISARKYKRRLPGSLHHRALFRIPYDTHTPARYNQLAASRLSQLIAASILPG
jgi:hypothetical protein